MTTGKQSAVHAQQTSDGTFELHVESSESEFESEFDAIPPVPKERKLPIKTIMIAVLGVVVLGGVGYGIASLIPESSSEFSLEPVAGFKPYTGGANAPKMTRPRVAPVIPDEEFEDEIREEESVEVPQMPPPVLDAPREESEISPEESGWETEEAQEPDESGSLNPVLHQRLNMDDIKRHADVVQPRVSHDFLAKSRGANPLDRDLRGIQNVRRGNLRAADPGQPSPVSPSHASPGDLADEDYEGEYVEEEEGESEF